jgi:hypothetical protein
MSGIQFSERVLQSHARFEQYLASQDAIDKIRAEAEKPYVPREGKLGILEVTWVTITTPFRIYYCLFLEATATLLYYASPMRETALDLYVAARRQIAYTGMVLDNYLLGPYGNILVDVINMVSYDAHEVYAHPRINLVEILRDKTVLAHLHPTYIDEQYQLVLDKLGGQCSGMCDWTAYLYFKTKGYFTDPEHHLVSVVNQVSNGVGREAALWQVAQIDNPPILGLKKRCVSQLKCPTAEKVERLFKSLKPGLYSLGTGTHRMNLAVTDDRSTYLLEPNHGLVKETAEALSKRLCQNSVLKVCEISV